MSAVRNIKYIKEFIDGVEKQFDTVWDMLALLKESSKADIELSQTLINFQVELANILFKIEKEYQFNAKTHNQLKRSRKNYKFKEFKKLEIQCIEIKNCLNSMIYFGRSLGDAFVWIFYRHEAEMLEKHFATKTERLPVTTGGWCEIQFIKMFPVIDGQIVIYHNITNILRLGDVSLWNGKTGKLSGIGEIKSKKLDNGTVEIQLEVLGHITTLVPLSAEIVNNSSTFSYVNKERHERQIKRISESFSYLEKPLKNLTARVNYDSYGDKVEKLVKKTKEHLMIDKIDRGFMLACYRMSQLTFAERLTARDFKKEEIKNESFKEVNTIFTAPKHNYCIYRTIHYTQGMKVRILPGMRPLFWSDINIETLRQIYYGEIHLFSIYNPGFLLSDLDELGYNLSDDRKTLTMVESNGKITRIEGINLFLGMIHDHLHAESVVLRAILKSTEELKKYSADQPTRAKVHYTFDT